LAKQRPTDTPPRREPPPPASLEEALARARRHGRNAAAETLAMVQALLDAASMAASGRPASAHPGFARVAHTLGAWSSRLGDGADASPLLAALSEALDAEIARWQERARGDDAEARAVLRAFLGVRELLWELGVRSPTASNPSTPPTSPDSPDPDRTRAPGHGAPPRRGPRVQRVPVEG